MTKSRKVLVLAVAAAMAVATLAVPASASDGSAASYKVTITNLTDGQLMTPFVVATHVRRFNLFKVGGSATNGIQQLAENGGVPVLVDQLAADPRVSHVAVAGAAPIAPGGSVEVYVDAGANAPLFSLAGMLICTNDGFGGINRGRLPQLGQKTFYGKAYDAGTEVNTESYADLVPPCDGLGQTGTTNPELAESGRILPHMGILGIADLDPATHDWHGPVIKVTVERVG